MTERREKYHAVNNRWPDELPPLTGPEAISAAKRLYRFAMKRPFKGKWKLTSGRRYTWPRSGVFYVNPARTGEGRDTGWRDLVHMMSHYCHRRLHPGAKPHSGAHHFLEKEMVAYVLDRGWLYGRLKSKAVSRPVRATPDARLAKLDAAGKRWTTKLRRATTALKKIARQRAAVARRLAISSEAGVPAP